MMKLDIKNFIGRGSQVPEKFTEIFLVFFSGFPPKV